MTEPSDRPRSFRDLRVWQEAVALVVATYRAADAIPPAYAFLGDQLRRAARSVPANIAEGNGRSSRRDYLRCLHIARGSLQEIETDLTTLQNTTILEASVVAGLDKGVQRTGRLLNALIRSLSE